MESVMKSLPIIAALAATLSAPLATSPTAAQAPAAERVVVSYADLDLASPAGVATLDRRILSAAQTACGPISNADLHGTNLAHECRSRTVEQALSQTRRAIASARQGSATMLAGR
jgi:UrcA family protein